MTALFSFIITCGIGLTLFLLIQLFKIKKKNTPDKILISIFIIIFNFLSISYTNTNNYNNLSFFLFLFNDPIELLLGPLLFIYVKSLTTKSKKTFKRHQKHFIPTFIYFLLVTFPVFVSYIKGKYIFYYLKIIDHDYENLVLAFLIIYLNTYVILALKTFYKYQNQLKNQYSTIHKHKSIWIKRMLIGILSVCFIDLFFSLTDLYFGTEIDISNYLTPIASVVLMYYLGYNAINKTQLLIPIKTELIEKEFPKKENRSNLFFTEDEVKNYTLKIKEQLSLKQLFLDENLDLKTLANAVEISDKKLSTFINQELKTTFYDLINFYRIKAVKEKLSSSENNDLTIIAIANDCGFKSKTTFNRIFKKETHLSPSEYKKKYQKPIKISTIASFEPLKQ